MSGLEVRRATTEDAAGIASVHVHSWLAAYRGLMPDDMLDSLTVEERTESWLRFLEPRLGRTARAGRRRRATASPASAPSRCPAATRAPTRARPS